MTSHTGRAIAAIILAQPLFPSAAAAQAMIAFAPAEGVAYRLRTTETRNDGVSTQRFTVDRTIRFRRESSGFVAEMIVQPLPRTVGGGARAMFDTAYAALAGIPIMIRLDAAGALTGVDDGDALWTRMVDAIRHIGGDAPPDRMALALAQGLDALPPSRRTAMLTSALTGIIAAGTALPTMGAARPITIPAAPFGGGAASLSGTEAASAIADGVRLTVTARGTIATPSAPAATVILLRTRDVDTNTGLVIATREESSIAVTIDGTQRVLNDVLETSLTPLVS